MHGETEPLALGAVAGEGAWAVGEAEAALARNRNHVRAVEKPVRRERHRVVDAVLSERRNEGEVGVRDDDEIESPGPEVSDGRAHGPGESTPGCPEHLRALAGGEGRDLVVVADHVGGQRAARAEHARGELAGERHPLVRGHDSGETELGEAKRLDRHDECAHGASLGTPALLAAPGAGRYRARVRIVLGSDEETDVVAGIERHLIAAGHAVVRCAVGASWAEVGRAVALEVVEGAADCGIVCCYTGTGVSIAANKVPGVRCALCTDSETATGARRWNDANVLGLSLRLTSAVLAAEIVDAFLAGAPDVDTPGALAHLEFDSDPR